MTLRLTVRRDAWLEHVAATVASYQPATVVPVVKGNGYGFGRETLFPVASEHARWVCVGTVHELDGIPDALIPVVLTPLGGRPCHGRTVVTVAHPRDVEGLEAGTRVLVKLRSSMQRYGATPDRLGALREACAQRGLEVIGSSIHLPLAGTDDARVAEVVAWLPHLPDGEPLWVSHLGVAAVRRLSDGGRPLVVRLGTSLWHGDKSFLHLGADVIDTHPVQAGDRVGYRATQVVGDGTLVLVGCGSAHGVAPLDDGRSPFHFGQRRLTLVEAPHMHTSMAFVPNGESPPAPGDWVDVQRPLITTRVDEIEWV